MKVLDVTEIMFIIKGNINNKNRFYNRLSSLPELNINIYAHIEVKECEPLVLKDLYYFVSTINLHLNCMFLKFSEALKIVRKL